MEKNIIEWRIHQVQRQFQSSVLFTKLPASLQRSMEVASETGASIWLSTLPIQEHGFAIHKGAFGDALCLCYGWQPNLLPTTCVWGKTFSIEHASNCPCYPPIQHNGLWDITATCHNIGNEHAVCPTTSMRWVSQVQESKWCHADDAHVDIVACRELLVS